MIGRSRQGAVGARCVVLGASIFVVACDPPGLGRSNPDFLVVGHHGAPNLSPENTVPSFEAGVAVGANAMEIDFCITRDHVLVALHDCDPDAPEAIARQAGAEGYEWLPAVPPPESTWRRPAAELTLVELRAHYGYRRADGGPELGATIPTLDEVLTWCSSEPRLRAVYLDLKFESDETEPAAQILREVWSAWQSDDALRAIRFHFLTVHRSIVDTLKMERVASGADALRVVWDFEKEGGLSASIGAGLRDVSVGFTPSFTWSGYKREIAEMVRAREDDEIDSVLAWTFDNERWLAELLYYSVDGIITNDPATLHHMWQETLE